METINLMSELTPAHFLMVGLGLQMVTLLAMWLAAEAMPAKLSASRAGFIRQTATAQILRADFPRARPAPAHRWTAAPGMLERNAA